MCNENPLNNEKLKAEKEMGQEFEPVSQELCEKIFNQLDKNHDGAVTPAEVIIALRKEKTHELARLWDLPERIR